MKHVACLDLSDQAAGSAFCLEQGPAYTAYNGPVCPSTARGRRGHEPQRLARAACSGKTVGRAPTDPGTGSKSRQAFELAKARSCWRSQQGLLDSQPLRDTHLDAAMGATLRHPEKPADRMAEGRGACIYMHVSISLYGRI